MGKPGNENAVKHGVYALAVAGRVPLKIKGGQFIRVQIRKMCRELVAAVEAATGREPTIYQHALIHSSTRHEARARLLERWLAEQLESLGGTDRAALLKGIGDATDARDKALRALGLDREATASAWDVLYRDAPAADLEHNQTTAATPAGQQGAQGGQ